MHIPLALGSPKHEVSFKAGLLLVRPNALAKQQSRVDQSCCYSVKKGAWPVFFCPRKSSSDQKHFPLLSFPGFHCSHFIEELGLAPCLLAWPPCHMASALTIIGLDDELAAIPAPWRDRVQHHARRFQEKNATTVLNRYEQQRRIMSRPQLEKHAFHVASWLVLPEVRRSHGDSVEALLSRYLESLDGQPLCERLKVVLSLVSASSGVAGLSGLLGKGQKRKVEMMQAEEPEKPDSSKPVDACGEKAVRLMQKASQMWQNHPSECREAYVESLEQEVQEADGAENSAKLRIVLRRAVAALSPPRRLGDGCEGKMTASIPSNDEWTLATNLQSRLRKIVLRCLDRVDMADLRVAPVLQCLQSLLQRFQELVTGQSRIACKKQWARLQAKCASTVPPEAAASLSARAKGADDGAGIAKPESSGSCPHGKLRRSCAQCRGCPHGKWAYNCPQCSVCPHGKVKRNCSECTPCPHGKAKRICSQCTGCPHSKQKQYCLQCGACPHGKIKQNCLQCSACPHGKIKNNCVRCSACPHGKIKKNCVQCSACPHGKLKRNCRMCAEARGKVNCTLSG